MAGGVDIDVYLNFKQIEKLGFDRPTATMLLRAGKRLALAARDRVFKKGIDGDDKPITRPQSRGWWLTTNKDPRMQGYDLGVETHWIQLSDGRRVHSDRPNGRAFEGGYADFKRQLPGARPKIDGHLTGAMWKSLTVSLGSRMKGRKKIIRIHFRGSSPVPAYTATARRTVTRADGTKVKAKVRVRRRKLPNQTKANQWQLRSRSGTKSNRPITRLLGVEQRLLGKLVDEIIRKQGLRPK